MDLSEVEDIHHHLVFAFANSGDPIEPPGIKNQGLLDSAVHRQLVGSGDHLKYSSPVLNAASLCYGICSNHPFHNGNKRTALVATLCHLDKNGLTFKGDVSQDSLYSFMLKVASHKFAPKHKSSASTDKEVAEMARWLNRRTRQVKKGERIVTFRELKAILRSYDFVLENPKGNYVDVVGTKKVKQRKGFFGSKMIDEKYRVAHMPYPGDGVVVGKKLLKSIRQNCNLTVEFGVDSEVFYANETPVDQFVSRYQKTLGKLAKT